MCACVPSEKLVRVLAALCGDPLLGDNLEWLSDALPELPELSDVSAAYGADALAQAAQAPPLAKANAKAMRLADEVLALVWARLDLSPGVSRCRRCRRCRGSVE